MSSPSTVNVPPDDREVLTFWTHPRSRGVLERGDRVPRGVSKPRVIAWKRRYATEGLAGLDDRPKPGRKPQQSSTRPRSSSGGWRSPSVGLGVTHWSSRSLAAELGLSHVTIVKVWRKWNLRPWRSETIEFSTDPEGSVAISSLGSSTYDTDDERPAIRAYCSPRCPSPPIPKTATVSAGAPGRS